LTTATKTQQRYWEDVAEGEELTGYDLYLSETKVAEQVSGSQDFYAVHHDRPFARAGGHKDIFFNTGFTRAALSHLLTDFTGDDGWVRRLSYEMRRMNRPGDTLKLRGKVTKKVHRPGRRASGRHRLVGRERPGRNRHAGDGHGDAADARLRRFGSVRARGRAATVPCRPLGAHSTPAVVVGAGPVIAWVLGLSRM